MLFAESTPERKEEVMNSLWMIFKIPSSSGSLSYYAFRLFSSCCSWPRTF